MRCIQIVQHDAGFSGHVFGTWRADLLRPKPHQHGCDVHMKSSPYITMLPSTVLTVVVPPCSPHTGPSSCTLQVLSSWQGIIHGSATAVHPWRRDIWLTRDKVLERKDHPAKPDQRVVCQARTPRHALKWPHPKTLHKQSLQWKLHPTALMSIYDQPAQPFINQW